jgi:4-hydroxy-2-oxoheptanedioate aldolase
MRNSRVLREVREGQVASCLKLNITHPVVVELAGRAGASVVWLCNEHVPGNWTDIEHCVRAAKIYDMDVIVRVSKGSYSDYIKPFEADAAGIMVPHIESAEEARRIVDTCRFLPLGKRALDGGNVDGGFCQIPMVEYIEQSNREKFLIFQIESPEAVEKIDEIAAVPGYDFLLFGPGDYSHRIGDPGNIQHPAVLAARIQVEEAARRHGKKLFGVGAPGSPSELLERGYVITSVASDVHSLGTAFNAAVGKHAGVNSHYSGPA